MTAYRLLIRPGTGCWLFLNPSGLQRGLPLTYLLSKPRGKREIMLAEGPEIPHGSLLECD